MTYALRNIETRGKLFVGPGEEVYEGMIVGENPRTEDLPVNPTKAKHVTNHRAAGSDKSEALTPAVRFSLERAIEYIAPDELVEVTLKVSVFANEFWILPLERERPNEPMLNEIQFVWQSIHFYK